MSRYVSENLPSPDPGKEKSVLWVQSYYLDLTPHTLKNMIKCRDMWTSEVFSLEFFNFSLWFKFEIGNKNDFIFTCIRTPVSPSSDDHTLQFYCSFNVFDKDLTVLVLHSNKYEVVQKYDLNSLCKYFTSNACTTELELKVLVKIIEYNCCKSSLAYNQQEKEFRKLKEKYFNDEPVLREMCYILDIPRAQDIFTGRQSKVFAALKRTYIARTSTFATEIATYMKAKRLKAKEPFTPVPWINLALILNYILNGEQIIISDSDLLRVYTEGHRLGLNYLVELSSESILGRVENHNFRLEAFQAADFVGDTILFDKIIDKFCSRETEVLNNKILEERKKTDMKWRFMAQVLERRLRERNKNHVENGTHQSTSTSRYPLLNDSPTSTVTLRND